ncbi:Lrp/AsnC ligand binding domain-containing protein [Streptomyces sulphureus]|uniref:Lrp/AsnC family transcriptional regulator n=1 Tax=Streptomyces sulphureus TaxID=47758 RepID=UPI00035F4CBF
MFHLRQDGRLSNVELAKRVGLTPPPCLRRLKRLEDEGVITGYRAVVDPEAEGRGLDVLVDIEVYSTDKDSILSLEEALASYDEVVECRRMFGRPEYVLRVAVEDHAAYEAFVINKLTGLPGILRVESNLTMKKVKGDI